MFPDCGFALLAVILYFPFGLLLATVRIFIGFHAYVISCVLPKAWLLRCFVLRMMCGVLGIWIFQEQPEVRNRNAKVIVANYTTPLDHLAIELVYPNVMPSMWDLPATLMWLLGYEDMGAKLGRETLIQNAKLHCQESSYPLLAFPEGATTSGKVGLLKFSVWPFSLDVPIQPIVVQITRPSVFAISPVIVSSAECLTRVFLIHENLVYMCNSSVIGSWWWMDIFWFLFVPYSCFNLRVLPVMEQLEDETAQEFTARVQQVMAVALHIEPTSYTSADKIEHFKQQELKQQRQQDVRNENSFTRPSGSNSEMEMLVNQVKTVLPHVPLKVIRRDLSLTKDVDLTITNILEGRVPPFTPEQPSVEAERAGSPGRSSATNPQSTSSAKSHNSASSVGVVQSKSPVVAFGHTSAERHMTFAERKKALIDNARRAYIEKHGLSVETGSSSSVLRHREQSSCKSSGSGP